LGHASRVTSLGQLATGLAHELNQPLTAIANYAESALIASSTPGDQDVRHPLLERIRDSALRAGLIVRRMRNFVRPSPGSRANVSLPSLIDDVIQLCQPELRADGVQMEMHVDTEAGTVCVDAIQIQQVLVNLLQNALQAMRPLPRENRHLRLRASREAGEIQVDVEDSGPGFDPRQSGLIPEQFATTRSEGLGMGLAISRTIVTAHGGRLWAANRPEGGARVSFSLPVMGSHADLIDTSADCVRRR
jgi:C4-dicarboxylate-specific signal transduction histidine kinase